MSSDAAKGKAALDKKDYPTAITHLTAALRTSQSPLWLIQRSTAYQRSGNYDLALADADNAVVAAVSRSRRELIGTSQFRRAVALHGLGRYGDARLCLNWCNKYNDKEKGLTIWVAKTKNDYEQAGGEDAEVNKTTVKEFPDKVEEVNTGKQNKDAKEQSGSVAKQTVASAPAVAKPLAQTPKEKIRHEWYQSSGSVTIEIFAKGIPKEKAEVVIEEGNLEVRFPVLASNSTYDFTASPLFSRIDPARSSFRITPHKLEIILQKSVEGIKWSSLEGSESVPSNLATASATNNAPAPALGQPAEKSKAPAYPTSSRTGPKDWEKVLDEKDDDAEDAGDVNDFFKKLYKDADPDTRRAMMKSFQESNGTALSTSWGDVGSKTYETSPPEGLEAKKWES